MNTRKLQLPASGWEIELKESLTGDEFVELETLNETLVEATASVDRKSVQSIIIPENSKRVKRRVLSLYIKSAKDEKGEPMPIGDSLVQRIMANPADDYIAIKEEISRIESDQAVAKKKSQMSSGKSLSGEEKKVAGE